MKLCYQVATPDVEISDDVTAFQGPLGKSLSTLKILGYDGAEFMTLDPKRLDWQEIKRLLEKNDLCVPVVCTGEVFGQLKWTYTDPDDLIRQQAIQRTKEIIDFAGFLGANVNIGRIRGQYNKGVAKSETEQWAIEAFRSLSDYAAEKNVRLALETVTIMQTNFINTLEEAVDMIKSVDRKNFYLMMDTFHLNLEEKNIYDAIRTYSPYNIHVHLSDNNRRYPGQCGMDFMKIIRTFKECGYDGAYTTEIFQLPDMDTAARESVRFLKPILEDIYGKGGNHDRKRN